MKTYHRPAGPDPETDGYEEVTTAEYHEQQNYVEAGFKEGPAPKAVKKAEKVDDRKVLRAEYKAKTGKSAFGGWDADTLRAKIAEA